jgi:hypothetical protein
MREDLTRARTQGRSMPHSFRPSLYTLIAKRCIFDVWPGWLYVLTAYHGGDDDRGRAGQLQAWITAVRYSGR